MGGGCVCNNYIKNCFVKSPESIISLENYENMIPQNNYNKITNKTSHILYNIIENNQENNQDNKRICKRFSDFQASQMRRLEKNSNLKNIRNKINNNEGRNTSSNEQSFINNPNNNDDTTKKNISNVNSSNLGSNLLPTNNTNNTNIAMENKNKHNNVMSKIKGKQKMKKRSETLINYNMGENNFIFINISRGSSFLHHNELEKIESITPKMMMEKENLENITNGKKLFSHFCNNRMNSNQIFDNSNSNQIITNPFIPFLDMNKYCEEMLNIINIIRTNPESFIKDIDYIINNNIKKTEEGIFLISNEVDEKIKLMDNYIEMFERTKNNLKNIANSPEKINNLKTIVYNDELEIILDESNYDDNIDDNNEIEDNENDIKNIPAKLNLIYEDDIIDYGSDEEDDVKVIKYNDNLDIIDFDDEEDENKSDGNIIKSSLDKMITNKYTKKNVNNKKPFTFKKKQKIKKKRNINNYLDLSDDVIANLILQKRKEIKSEYPKNIFKMSVIKDIKISILIELTMEELFKQTTKTTLKDIIFDPNYKNFAVSWANEINRNFISISCFA